MIAESQAIAEDRTRYYLLRSSAIMIAGSQTIAEVCLHMVADDRRTCCDLRSAIVCDHMERKVHKKYRAMVNPGGRLPPYLGYTGRAAEKGMVFRPRCPKQGAEF